MASSQNLEEDQSGDVEEYPLPSNQEYLSYYVRQDEWKPTRPIRPIAAMYASPGPANVALPSTIGDEELDPTKPRAPSFKIGEKLTERDATFGPGPGAYNVSEKSNQMPNSKAPKMGTAKRFDEKVETRSPGPAAYDRKFGDKFMFPSAPAFSIRKSERGKMKIPYVPAPNAYTLPSSIGTENSPFAQSPKYSMGRAERFRGRKSDDIHDQNPGPAAYMLPPINVSMSKSPGFYMGMKTPLVSGASYSPGPGVYSRHLVKFNKYSTPRITFGIKHSPFKVMPGFSAEN